ncbi:RNA polymerase I-specific transcription-initiation factor-domain-containing protein [Elsinoe ampelina]|uniref:RNA polymerase I-specific transcription-initiation factor-domain-containing protein n=1 Tax=Elsinoe ampelina TaxID=302913 RepID=A0A6A6GBY9_9PEZI|nr:RNA polymerase I-specific transcription-initiation factor-domain-containing protein [Elsinoe ampelina]
MTDTYDDGLGYGHLGEPEYCLESGTWLWKRSLDHVKADLVGAPQILVSGPEVESPGPAQGTSDSSAVRDPALISISSYLADESRVSGDVDRALGEDDPLVGDLLDFGHVSDKLTHRTIPVAAFPGNTARTRLCIARVQNQRQGWDDDRHCFIMVPVIAGEQGYWSSPSPIQQISFCVGPAYHKGALAIRTHQATFLLRARFSRDALRSSSSEHASRLKVSVLCVIPTGFMSVPVHSHASVNPWFERHFATVSATGAWHVWEGASPLLHEGVEDATRIADGVIRESDSEQDIDDSTVQYDGWTRILWVRDTDTLMVCTRTQVCLVDVPSSAAVQVSLEIAKKRSAPWILDVQVDLTRPDRLFFLTTMYVYYVSIGAFERAKDGISTSGIQTLQKIRHFRDHEDRSLHMVVCADAERTMVSIMSSLSLATTFLTFSTPEGQVGSCLVSDVVIVNGVARNSRSSILSSRITRAHWDDIPTSDHQGVAGRYRSEGVRFFLLTSLLKDFSMTQQLLAIRPESSSGILHGPSWRSRIRGTATELSRSSFVVDDDDVENQTRTQTFSTQQTSGLVQHSQKRRIANYERIYNLLAESNISRLNDATSIILKIQDALRSDDPLNNSVRLLTQFVDNDVTVSDLDQVIEAFGNLLLQHGERPLSDEALVLSQIGDTRLLGLSGDVAGADIKQIYQHIISRWLSPLSGDVPGRVRLAREQLARRIAATLAFASHKIQPATAPPQPADLNSSPPPLSQPFSSQIPSSQLFSSQPFPQHRLPSAPLPPSTSQAALSRLFHYTSLTTPTKPLPASTSATSRILAHWDPSTSPADYNWFTTRSRLAAQRSAEEEAASLTAKQREKLERKRARLEQRRRREEERLASQLGAAGAAPRVGLSQSQGQSQTHTQRGGQAQRFSQSQTRTPARASQTGIGNVAPARPTSGAQAGATDTNLSPRPGPSVADTPRRTGVVEAERGLAIRSSPSRASPSRLLSPALTRSPSAGRGRGGSREGGRGSSQLLSSQVQSSQMQSSQMQMWQRGDMGPPPRKKKKRTEGF